MELADLIKQAAAAAGNQTALAKALGLTPQKVSDWKHDREPCPLHWQARIAQIAGVDAKEWVWQQVSRQIGRATAAVLLTLALALAAVGAPGAGGSGFAGSRSR